MKLIVLITISISTLFKAFGQEEENIKHCFNSFKVAFTEQDADKALEYIDKKSVDILRTNLKNTKAADSSNIARLDPFERILILSTRLLATREQVKAMDVRALLKFYLTNNLYGSYEFTDLGEITIEKDKAKGQIISMGQSYDFYLYFSKEKNKWKYFIYSPLEVERIKLQQILEKNKMTESEFILRRVKRLTNKDVTRDTWKPIK